MPFPQVSILVGVFLLSAWISSCELAKSRDLVSSEPYQISWRTDPFPVPVNQPFQLDLTIHPPPTGGEVLVDAQMPLHGHGMLHQPRVDSLGPSRFRVKGMLFHMKGHWKLSIYFRHGAQLERADYEIPLGEFDPDEIETILQYSPLPPLPDDPTNAYDTLPQAVSFGRSLFFDERLSATGNISCATCHDPAQQWGDGKKLGEGLETLHRHTMTLWNAGYNRWYFWDGRADSLWSQALQPLEDPREHGGRREDIVRLIHQDDTLRKAYTEVFGPMRSMETKEDVNRIFANLGKALAAFVRGIVSKDSPFDRYVEGLREGDPEKSAALSQEARRGLKLFIGKANCHFCHSGPNFSDGEFHNNRAPFTPGMPLDLGRFEGIRKVQADPFNGKGIYSDRPDPEKTQYLSPAHAIGTFKTPTLRNVALTAPYMHQGQFATLEEVVEFYSTLKHASPSHGHGDLLLRPLHLSTQEKKDLIAFLESLTGTAEDL